MTNRVVSLRDLLARLPASTQTVGDLDRRILSLTIDSRKATDGALFIALRGTRHDGHDFVEQAAASGAAAIVAEAGHVPPPAGATVLYVPDSRRALSALAAAFFDDPSRRLDVAGVTGTNGKTTTTAMIASVCHAAGRRCGTIGTVGASFDDRSWPLENTTPLPNELHGLLAEMRDAGADTIAMEVSSHALALDRVGDVRFRVAALTNVTRDHLDFHGTLEAYAAAKQQLFVMTQAAVFNADDPHGRRWADEFRYRIPTTTYGIECEADIQARGLEPFEAGSRFNVDGTTFTLRIPGRFNVSNALAAIGVARTLGIEDDATSWGLAALDRVPGRMERFEGGGIAVVVDYAHTPDALEHALTALRETTRGSLSVVFGCGGDRDRGKRPEMGTIAAHFADRVYLTSDNPRSEDPQAIVDEILAGMASRDAVVELDRAQAIERAIAEAARGDVILVAGKGHERYQITGSRVTAFDDAEIAREALERRKARS
jgi:UDP-N-acetylmuramyl-tripeptide synthetase